MKAFSTGAFVNSYAPIRLAKRGVALALAPVWGLMEYDDVSGVTLGQFAFDIHGPFFYVGGRRLFGII